MLSQTHNRFPMMARSPITDVLHNNFPKRSAHNNLLDNFKKNKRHLKRHKAEKCGFSLLQFVPTFSSYSEFDDDIFVSLTFFFFFLEKIKLWS